MKIFPFKANTLLWRILVSTSLAVTLVFALTGWMVERYAATVSEHSLEEEIRTSLQAYESLWRTKVHNLAEISRIISSMSDVRAAFMTRDQATIRDTAEQLWKEVSDEDVNFLVLDPAGSTIASLGGRSEFSVNPVLMHEARLQFPKQVYGYMTCGTHLYYVVLTPVYVQAQNEPALLNVLLIALNIDNKLADELKKSTHGSDFAFVAFNVVMAGTESGIKVSDLQPGTKTREGVRRTKLNGEDRLMLGADLRDTTGRLIGELFVIRSLAKPRATLVGLQRNVAVLWTAGIIVALALTYALSKRVLEPVRTLDRAAGEVSRRNYDYRVPVETDDELGRLATTFNQMCDSIQKAREDLVRQEQISTISRLSSSLVHDLRNPLAAIYGGAEMLVDAELSPEQQHRLAANIYSSSRRIQGLLQELLDVSTARDRQLETCKLIEIVAFAREELARSAELRAVSITSEIPEDLEVVVSRDRLERVFVNLISNAIDAMPDGGSVRISSHLKPDSVLVLVEDTGFGIPDEAWPNLFRPFASFGKRNGLGLGLALSRQSLIDNGGDLWAEKKTTPGARFVMRLPITSDGPATPNYPSQKVAMG
ncbi:MAG TPA: HAMP domain-containing sensor histidine kinase [Bryobacteraceae bacterium]|jgi:signal transduction histidine kinase|nr:HAMP domain-containing sensor histidine kinase [Bryobacteraceae bacterium]